MVMISYNQAIEEEITELLENLHKEGISTVLPEEMCDEIREYL